MAADKLNWGILGTGNIAKTFAQAVAKSQTGALCAVGSRQQQTADEFAGANDVPHAYASYDAVLSDQGVDAVYISLPNHLHLEWTVKAADAGKHVLCEKPLTLNHAQAVELISAVRQRNVFMMEAFMYRCHPQTRKVVDLVRDGAIGDVRVIQAHFGYNMGGRGGNPYENIRLRNEVGGGGIMDVGCYAVSAVRLIAGAALGQEAPAEPDTVTGVAHIGEIGRVDEWATAALKFPNDIIANVTCGSMAAVGTVVRVWGSHGHLEVPNPWFPGRAQDVEKILVARAGGQEEIAVPARHGLLYALEADTVARSLPAQQAPYPCMTWDDSLGNMKVLDRWRECVGLTFDPERT